MLSENELWLPSFYRLSEINGAQFFARLASSLREPEIRHDMTRHFSEEAQHAWYFTDCIHQLGHEPIQLSKTYQDRYLDNIGLPANIMEVLAITQVFERRVINHYAKQSRLPAQNALVRDTFARIMDDEHWHLKWVNEALKQLEPKFGKENIEATIKRYWEVDKDIYENLITEHDQRFAFLKETTSH
jgi:rubrerythrin